MVSHCPSEEKVFSIREQPIDFACWLGSLAQSVEHQHIKLRVVGSSPAGVHFFFLFLSITQTLSLSDKPHLWHVDMRSSCNLHAYNQFCDLMTSDSR